MTNIDMLRMNVPGVPGEDYPILAEVPSTSFSCEGKSEGGYYADPEAGCQPFHVCANDGRGGLTQFSFLCHNGSLFNQEFFICDWWFNVDCSRAESFYFLNEQYAAEREQQVRGAASNSRQNYAPSPSSQQQSHSGAARGQGGQTSYRPRDNYASEPAPQRNQYQTSSSVVQVKKKRPQTPRRNNSVRFGSRGSKGNTRPLGNNNKVSKPPSSYGVPNADPGRYSESANSPPTSYGVPRANPVRAGASQASFGLPKTDPAGKLPPTSYGVPLAEPVTYRPSTSNPTRNSYLPQRENAQYGRRPSNANSRPGKGFDKAITAPISTSYGVPQADPIGASYSNEVEDVQPIPTSYGVPQADPIGVGYGNEGEDVEPIPTSYGVPQADPIGIGYGSKGEDVKPIPTSYGVPQADPIGVGYGNEGEDVESIPTSYGVPLADPITSPLPTQPSKTPRGPGPRRRPSPRGGNSRGHQTPIQRPKTSYGVPKADPISTSEPIEAPATSYGVPLAEPLGPTAPSHGNSDAVSAGASSSVQPPAPPSTSYGVPQAEPISTGYGVPRADPISDVDDIEAPATNYGLPRAEPLSYDDIEEPSQAYGVPLADPIGSSGKYG